jgi:hypothetical protein
VILKYISVEKNARKRHAKNPPEKKTGTLRECYNIKFPLVKAGLVLLVAGTECEYTCIRGRGLTIITRKTLNFVLTSTHYIYF